MSATTDQPWTIGRLLNWTKDYLAEKGSDAPRLEAEILLAEARGCSRIDLYTAFDDISTEGTRVAYRELVRRRTEGTPVAYLVGKREFYSIEFQVTPAVLIPRPETELLVVALTDLVKSRDSAQHLSRICDVGTGSGILAVCAAKHILNAQVTAIDISNEALEVAKKNAIAHNVSEQIQFVQGDLLSKVAEDVMFDFILSNPPYVSTAEMTELLPDVHDHEPHLALHAGECGTEVIARLLLQAADHLVSGGDLLVEISPMIAEAVRQLVDEHPELEFEEIIRDGAGHERVAYIRRR